MSQFKTIEISDKDWMTEAIKRSGFMSCEYSFANNLAWQRLNNTRVCSYKDYCLLRSEDNGAFYYDFPFGLNINSPFSEYKEAIDFIMSDAFEKNADFILKTVSKEAIERIKEVYGDVFSISTDKSTYDYIYSAESLIGLKGKKYHAKRNHIANLSNRCNWKYYEINDNNINDALIFAVNIFNDNDEYSTQSKIAEQFAINTYFSYYNELNLRGGIIVADGKIIALSIGESINNDTFAVHIEKADRDYNGAYPAICNSFLKNEASKYKYINREEDLGIEGLRKSKMSYYPLYLLEKYTLTFEKARID